MAAPDIKAIIFDCFGVLYIDNKRSLLDKVPPERLSELRDVFMGNNYGFTDRKTYLARVAEIVEMTPDAVEAYMAQEHRLNEPLVRLITNELKGRYRIGLLSNIGPDWIEDFFSRHQLHDLFDEVILSGEEGIAKPNPAIFELMAAKFGLHTGECVMIDDIEENCEGAQIAGMAAIHFRSNDQLLDELSELTILHNENI